MDSLMTTIGAAAVAAMAGGVHGQCTGTASDAGWAKNGSCGGTAEKTGCEKEWASGEGERARVQTVAWEAPERDIVQTAVGAGRFTILARALKAAGLVDALKGEGPFTVFAPTDEAFGKLAPGTVEMLLKPENRETLRSVLLYHVVPGRVYSDQAVKGGKAETAQGGTVMIKTSREGVWVNDAGVVTADVEASNGVIHVIDTVLMPE